MDGSRQPRPADDLIQPFQIDGPGLRGRLVRLGKALDDVLGRHDYPDAIAQMLGEMLVLAAALSAALKYEGVFTLQTKGNGPVGLMVADVTSGGDLRGYAQFDDARLAAAVAAPTGSPVPRLLGGGYLAFTVDQGQHTERYQGIVELTGATLAECVHHYFRQSEQLQAGIKVAAARLSDGRWRGGGIMLQRVPAEGGERGVAAPLSEAEEDDWRRSVLLLGSSTDAELCDPDLAPDMLLYRLFHEDGVRVYTPQPLRAGCRCSRERVQSVLQALPRAEVEDLEVDGQVEVTCEFCSTRYLFDDEALEALYGTT